MNLDIYRGTSIWVTIRTDDKTRLISQILGADIIKSFFNSHIFLDIKIGDFIVYDGVIYYINSLPNIKKNSINSYDYDITFESESYELLKTQFLDSDGNSDFYLVGNLETFIDLIVTNMNREHTDWVKGTWDKTSEGEEWVSAKECKLLKFKENNCLQVLQELCKEKNFEGEFYLEFELDFVEGAELPYLPADSAVIGYKLATEAKYGYKPAEAEIVSYTKNICFTNKAGSDSGLTFKYKQGLRDIRRTTLSEKNIVTRLYAFGSDKNLAIDYRSHSRRLKFVSDGKSYLEKNIDKYGTIEHTKIYDDIYPHREGTITWTEGDDITQFRDSEMDFNLNDCLLPGVTAKLHFNSGDLGGYEFEVHAYNHTTREFTIIKFKDEQGYILPNDTLKPKIGDKYVLLDIKMPEDPYIIDVETALQAKAQAYLNDNCEPRVTYILEPDWRYFKVHLPEPIELKAGDFITIEDTDLGINVVTRIVRLTKSIANKYKYMLGLTDHLEVQLIQRLYSAQEDLKKRIEIGYGGDIIRARRNWRTSEELRSMIYDTDGKFDMDNIRPLSVQTGMLSVGTKSTQYILKEIEIEGNYLSNVSKFRASEGQLIHLTIDDEIRTWAISENIQDDLIDEDKAYYIYAKCTKSADPGYTGWIIADEVQRKFDDDDTYYYFLIGILHSVVDGVRGISLTYGQTIINGKFIQTGSVKADQIASNAITAIKIIAGAIETDKLDAEAITAEKIAANAIETDKLILHAVTADKIAADAIYTNAIQAGAVTADRLSAAYIVVTGAAADVNANVTTISGGKITANTITVTQLNFTPVKSTDVIARINASAEGIKIDADNIYISGLTTFQAGYNPTGKIAAGGAAADVNAYATTINGGKITTYSIAADKINVDSLSAIKAILGTVHAGTIYGTRVRVGGGEDEDIYFEDSEVRLYDAGGRTLNISKSGYTTLQFALGASASALYATGILQLTSLYGVELWASTTKTFICRTTGTFQLPTLISAPSGHTGAIAFDDGDQQTKLYTQGAWRHHTTNAGW